MQQSLQTHCPGAELGCRCSKCHVATAREARLLVTFFDAILGHMRLNVLFFTASRQSRRIKMKPKLKLIAALLCTALLAGCERTAWFACEPVKDWGPESLGLATPAPLPFEIAKLDLQAIAPLYTGGVPVIAALVGGRHAEVENYFAQLKTGLAFDQQYWALQELGYLLHKRGLYVLPMAQQWVAQAPDSKAAKLMLGLAYSDAAARAHGGGYASETTAEQMDVYRQRLALAQPLLVALAKDEDAIGLMAREKLVHGYFLNGYREEGWTTFDALIGKLPSHPGTYINALEYAHPKWSCARSEERAAHVLKLAAINGLSAQRQQLLAQIVESNRRNINDNPDPTAWRAYWEARTAAVPLAFNLSEWLHKEMEVENWPAVLALAQRILDVSPTDSKTLYTKAWALQKLGKNDEAFTSMVSAATAGSDGAMGQIVYAYVRGTLGRKQKDFDTMYEYCKFGAALGLPSAANCMASSHTDGFGGAKRDNTMAVSWHLLAARGGEINSMHDLGVLLPRVVSGDDGRLAGEYWMRKAANGKHSYALKKVEDQTVPVASLGCRISNKPSEFVELMLRFYAFFYSV